MEYSLQKKYKLFKNNYLKLKGFLVLIFIFKFMVKISRFTVVLAVIAIRNVEGKRVGVKTI